MALIVVADFVDDTHCHVRSELPFCRFCQSREGIDIFNCLIKLSPVCDHVFDPRIFQQILFDTRTYWVPHHKLPAGSTHRRRPAMCAILTGLWSWETPLLWFHQPTAAWSPLYSSKFLNFLRCHLLPPTCWFTLTLKQILYRPKNPICLKRLPLIRNFQRRVQIQWWLNLLLLCLSCPHLIPCTGCCVLINIEVSNSDFKTHFF